MSLVVWLPLTKDLRNQGLSNVIVTNNGATFNSAGKLGGCYIFDGVDDAITVGNLSTLVTDNFSFACWFYHDDTWSSKNYETIFGGPSGFELETKSGSTNSPVIRAYSWGQGTFTYELNKWNHLVMTRTTSETKFYLNGELKLTGTAGTIPSGNYFVGSWSSTTGQNFKGKVNDVRIYDHCLSPMEVKELAKGLVLHYPLNRQGWGQENLDNFSSVVSNWTMESLSGSNYSDSSYGNVIKLVTNAANQRMYHNVISILWQSGQVYTVSFLAKADQNGRTCDMSRSIADFSPTFTLTTQWKRYSGKITSTATPGGGSLSFRINQSGATVYITQIKLEKGIIATPYCPSSSEALYTTMGLNGTTEYDCSGFCNNGTRTGTFTWTSDTPRYQVSTKFTGTQFITADSPTSEGATLALWVKTTSTSNAAIAIDYKSKLGFGFYSGVIIPSCNGNIKITYATTNYTINQWNHIVVVRNSSSALQLYINGVLQTNTTSTQDYWSGGVIDGLSIAARPNGSSPVSCQVSDVRIYATALSADDVKSLYQNSAYIDSSGNVYGAVHSEV